MKNTRPLINTGEAYWEDEQSYLTTPEFKDYAAAIEYIVHHSEVPVGTRQIHSILADNVRREWTLDALDSLRSVEKVPGLIDRWKVTSGHAPVHSKRWNGDQMAWLFGRTRYGRDDPGFIDLGLPNRTFADDRGGRPVQRPARK